MKIDCIISLHRNVCNLFIVKKNVTNAALDAAVAAAAVVEFIVTLRLSLIIMKTMAYKKDKNLLTEKLYDRNAEADSAF